MDHKALVAEAATYLETLQGIRRELHQIPEFALELPKTQERILGSIKGLGEITLGKNLNSIALLIKGAHPGPTVLLRADMDALAVQEDTSEDFKTQMDLARQTILIRELFANYQKTHAVTDDEIKAEYDKFASANSGKEYRARHILVEKEADAKAIIAQLKKGGKFDEIAKKSSKDPGSGAKGGDLDWAPAGNYVAEFSTALTALTKGKMTETPVKSQFGYHVIRLDDVRDAQLPKLDDVKPQVSQQLQQQKLAKYQDELRSKAKVE